MASHFTKLFLALQLLVSSIQASSRPNINYWPHQPWRPMPWSPPRSKTCYVSTNGPGIDDSETIVSALKECNNGGHVIFRPDTVYTVAKPMNLTFLDSIDIGMNGALLSLARIRLIEHCRYRGHNSVYEQRYLLGGQLVQNCVPKHVKLLRSRWPRCQHFRRWNYRWTRPDLVGPHSFDQ